MVADEVRELPGGRLVTTVRTNEGVERVRPQWQALRPAHVVADPDFFVATGAHDEKIVRPHVVLLEREGRPEAMAVARLERQELVHRLGYRTVYKPRVRSLTVVTGGVLGEPDEEQFTLLLDELRRGPDGGEADLLMFSYLPLDSPAFRLASTQPGLLARQHVVRSGVRWELDLPGSLDELLRTKSAKHRQTLKRRRNKLEQSFDVDVRVFSRPDEIDELFAAVAVVAPKTYQHALGVAFGDTPAHRERTRVAMEQDWFRAWVLFLDGSPVAYWHGERYAGTFRTGNPGFDPKYDAYSVGTYLLLRAVDDLCRDPDVRVVDHGIGDAEYKRRYGTRSIAEGSVFVFPRTLRGALLNGTLTLVGQSLKFARWGAQRGGLLSRAKSGWRRRLGSA